MIDGLHRLALGILARHRDRQAIVGDLAHRHLGRPIGQAMGAFEIEVHHHNRVVQRNDLSQLGETIPALEGIGLRKLQLNPLIALGFARSADSCDPHWMALVQKRPHRMRKTRGNAHKDALIKDSIEGLALGEGGTRVLEVGPLLRRDGLCVKIELFTLFKGC